MFADVFEMIVICEELLDEFRRARRCEHCLAQAKNGCDPHHVFGRGLGGCTRLDIRVNLVALCRKCHTLYHDGSISRLAMIRIAAAREGVPDEAVAETVYRMRRESK